MMKGEIKWQEVVDNLLYFYSELLPGAASQANWTKEGVDRALSWGKYCERVARRLHHNGSVMFALAQTTQHFPSGITLTNMLDACHILLKLLIQNQLLEEDVKQHVKELASTSLDSSAVAKINLHTTQQTIHSRFLFSQLKGKKFLEVTRKLGIRLMLEAAIASGQDQLQECLNRLLVQPEGLSLLMDITWTKDKGSSNSVNYQVLTWVKRILSSPQHTNYKSLLRRISSLSPRILCHVMGTYPDLLIVILSAIQREVQMLEPYYDTEDTNWFPHDPASSTLGYPDLVRICSAMLMDQNLSAKLREAIDTWRLNGKGAVWADLIRDASHQRKQTYKSEVKANRKRKRT